MLSAYFSKLDYRYLCVLVSWVIYVLMCSLCVFDDGADMLHVSRQRALVMRIVVFFAFVTMGM